MKINVFGLPVVTNNTIKSPSRASIKFGNKETVSGDEFLSGTVKNNDNLEIFIKEIKQKRDIKNPTSLFLAVLEARKKDMKVLNTEKEMNVLLERIESSAALQNIALESRIFDEKEKSHILEIARSNIKNAGLKIEKIKSDVVKTVDYKNLKLLKKLAKILVNAPEFDPNYEDESGRNLINITLDAKDEEMAKLVMNHPDFDEEGSFANDFEKERFQKLKEKSFVQNMRSWLF